MESSPFYITTTDNIADRRIVDYLGVVRGVAVRVPTISKQFQAIGQVLGGNSQGHADMFTEVCEAARAMAYRRMIEHAREVGADAILAMRFDGGGIGEHAAEVLAYGTAVKLAPPAANTQ